MAHKDLQGTIATSTPAERVLMELIAGMHSVTNPVDTPEEVAPNVAYMRLLFVNICFIGPPDAGPGNWTLVDAGLPGSTNSILKAAEKRFGPDSPPNGIIITHGHFDHVGPLDELLQHWDVPVYAHEAEVPYLTGREHYVEPDPSAAAGLMAKLSPLYPKNPVDLNGHVHSLPMDASVPGMPGWIWIYTPGHTPGHISLFRPSDRLLIIGDSFTTVDQESTVDVITQKKEIHGPPKYFTPDWSAARASVQIQAALHPTLLIPSHGLPMAGAELERDLTYLAEHFDEVAVPEHGRYVAR